MNDFDPFLVAAIVVALVSGLVLGRFLRSRVGTGCIGLLGLILLGSLLLAKAALFAFWIGALAALLAWNPLVAIAAGLGMAVAFSGCRGR